MRRLLISAIAVLFAVSAFAQPFHRFTVKVGIDSHSVDSLGGEDNVKRQIVKMFTKYAQKEF